MDEGKYETFISVKKNKIECIYDGLPINFDQKKKIPASQFLKPVAISQRQKKKSPRYYKSMDNKEHSEINVISILEKDGVAYLNYF